MNTSAYRKNIRKLMFMLLLVALAGAAYMLVGVNFENQKLFAYAMKIRTPKLIVMLITAFAIGGASIVFQSIINNTIVTPCLLGMNSLYTLIHTAIVFFVGSGSLLARNANAAFDQAVNLGVDYDRTIRRLLLGVTLCIAVATAMVGPISFLGLIIANLSRQLLKTFRPGQLILGSALFGMIVLVGGQLIVEQVFTYAIPVSVFITVGGGIYFLYLLLTNRRV